jgi:hypothetical protein
MRIYKDGDLTDIGVINISVSGRQVIYSFSLTQPSTKCVKNYDAVSQLPPTAKPGRNGSLNNAAPALNSIECFVQAIHGIRMSRLNSIVQAFHSDEFARSCMGR